MSTYTEELAIQDLALVMGRHTLNRTSAYQVGPSSIADAYALIERHDLRVEAVLMSLENLKVLQGTHAGCMDTSTTLWGAEIFPLLMGDDVVYVLSRDFEEGFHPRHSIPPENNLPEFCRLDLTGIPPHVVAR